MVGFVIERPVPAIAIELVDIATEGAFTYPILSEYIQSIIIQIN